MNGMELDERIRRKLKEQKTELPIELEEKLMNTIQTAQRKRRIPLLIPIAAACLLVAAGAMAAILLKPAATPPADLSSGAGNGAAGGSELTQNLKEYKTVAEAEQAQGIDIAEPTVTAGGATLGKVIVYFAGTEPNSVAMEYYAGDVKAYQVCQTFLAEADAEAYLTQFAAGEKVQVNGQDVYLTNYDGAYNADIVRGTVYYSIASLESKLGRQDVLDIAGSMIGR